MDIKISPWKEGKKENIDILIRMAYILLNKTNLQMYMINTAKN